MDELRKMTETYLDVVSNEIKKAAQEFFQEMDENGDGTVSLPEFLAFMRQEEYLHLRRSDLFNQLCRDDSERLEFMDVMTLYYIIRSGRPFCDGCYQFIKGIYFCCIHCYCTETNYCLCSQCLKDKKYTKYCRGDQHHQFLDNFALLEHNKGEALKNAPSSSRVPERSTSFPLLPAATVESTSLALAPLKQVSVVPARSTSFTLHPAATVGSTSLALAPLKQRKYIKMRAKLKALERLLMAGGGVAQIIAYSIQ